MRGSRGFLQSKMKSLTEAQIEQFVEQGYVRLDQAFPRELADRGRELLWKDTGCDPADPATWTKPVVWLWNYDQEPFRRAVNMPLLHAAFDQLVGKGRWEPVQSRDFSSPVPHQRGHWRYRVARGREFSWRGFQAGRLLNLARECEISGTRLVDAFPVFGCRRAGRTDTHQDGLSSRSGKNSGACG